MVERRKLKRSRRDRVFGGVLGGLAEYFNIDSTLLRLIFIFLSFVSIKGAILLYIVLYIVMPDERKHGPMAFNTNHQNNTLIGITLILLGLILFFNELYQFITFKFIWPFLLILLGLYVLYKGITEGKNEDR